MEPPAVVPGDALGGGVGDTGSEILLLAPEQLPDVADPRHTDMTFWHAFVELEPWPLERFTNIRTIGEAIYGKVKIVQDTSTASTDGRSQPLIDKRLQKNRVNPVRESRRKYRDGFYGIPPGTQEDPWTEMGVLTLLRRGDNPFLVRMIGCFEDEQHIHVIMEYSGSEMFPVVQERGITEEKELLYYFWQILSGVEFLHRQKIAHCDLSLENVLLSNPREGARRRAAIIDFGEVLICEARDGRPLRYFHAIAKPMYRPPETRIPRGCSEVVSCARPAGLVGEVAQVHPRLQPNEGGWLFQVLLPDGDEGQIVGAELAGYDPRQCDIFCLGILMYILNAGADPETQVGQCCWTRFVAQGMVGVTAAQRRRYEVHAPQELETRFRMGTAAVNLMSSLATVWASKRLTATQALAHAALQGAALANGVTVAEPAPPEKPLTDPVPAR